MAQTKGFTLEELKTAIASYVASNKIADEFSATYNMAGLLDKIGKIFTVEQIQRDKLSKFDGEFLSFGKTVEEWQIDLLLPTAVESLDDVEAVKSHFPNYRKTTYSYGLGDQVFPVSRSYNDLNKGVNNEGQLTDLIMGIMKTLTNSEIAFRYSAKRQLAGRLADECATAMTDTGATLWAKGTSQSDIGKRFKNSSTGTKWAVLKNRTRLLRI